MIHFRHRLCIMSWVPSCFILKVFLFCVLSFHLSSFFSIHCVPPVPCNLPFLVCLNLCAPLLHCVTLHVFISVFLPPLLLDIAFGLHFGFLPQPLNYFCPLVWFLFMLEAKKVGSNWTVFYIVIQMIICDGIYICLKQKYLKYIYI